ncbi:MAG: alpha/beta hydrolase [Betaproteobacteria bacterium]|nr:alpha/beta hydrolase [Betaproteobacteria bacterium]
MRGVLNILISAITVYAVILLLVFLFQARLVYFPEVGRALVATPRAVGLDFEEVRLAADGATLHGWWVPATAARGAVLVLHGNAGNISHRLEYLTMFNRLGYATLIVDYRGYGKSSGTPSEDGTYRDGEAAWRHLTEMRKFAPRDIVLFGESLGGGVATWLALQHPPRALVLASTFTSAPDLGAQVYPWLPVRWLARIEYKNLERIPRITAPVLIAHSKGDDIIPFSHGQALFGAAREPKQFLEMRGGHNDGFIFMREEWVREVGAFLERAEKR